LSDWKIVLHVRKRKGFVGKQKAHRKRGTLACIKITSLFPSAEFVSEELEFAV